MARRESDRIKITEIKNFISSYFARSHGTLRSVVEEHTRHV